MLITNCDARTILRSTEVTRLGEGVDETGKLSEHAIRRTLKVLQTFREEMTSRGVVRGRLVATSAVRDGGNGEDFLARASAATGMSAELLTGDEEGRLAYEGAVTSLGREKPEGIVVLDIGGGSTEIVYRRGEDLHVTSLPLGCVRLTERHVHHDPPTPEDLAEVVSDIEEELARTMASAPLVCSDGPRPLLVGLAGTVSTLAALAEGLQSYTSTRLHHSVLSHSTVVEWCAQLASMTIASSAAIPAMVPGRASVILAGALVLREVMAWLHVDACTVSEHDILDGLVLSVL